MSYEIFWEEHGFIHRHKGLINAEDFQDVIEIFYGDSRNDDCKYVIADYSEATDHNFSDLQISVVAGYDIGASKSKPNLRQALVAKHPRIRQACEYYISLTSRSSITWETKLFDDPEKALRWAKSIPKVQG